MQIGEVSRITGLSKDTIRFWEKQGLIKVPRKDTRFNNYKEYSPAILRRLLMIVRLKSFGFTLNEAAGYLELIDSDLASCEHVSDTIKEKVQVLDQKIEELQQIKALLTNGVAACKKCAPTATLENQNCTVLTQDLLP